MWPPSSSGIGRKLITARLAPEHREENQQLRDSFIGGRASRLGDRHWPAQAQRRNLRADLADERINLQHDVLGFLHGQGERFAHRLRLGGRGFDRRDQTAIGVKPIGDGHRLERRGAAILERQADLRAGGRPLDEPHEERPVRFFGAELDGVGLLRKAFGDVLRPFVFTLRHDELGAARSRLRRRTAARWLVGRR